MAKCSQTMAVVITIFLFIILANPQQATARPRPGPAANSLDRLSGCHIDSKLQETCQRCAKATKSNVVYPMCCSNEDEAYVWCQKYMNYGIH